MTLATEIDSRRANIHTDGYPMSIGELVSMYRDGEIEIHPEFQRFFRWTDEQKSRLVESLLLGIPIPSIFVSQRKDGVWDVVDGLQRLSTIFQLMGELRGEAGESLPMLTLAATPYLPSLDGKVWNDEQAPQRSLGRDQQLIIKRAKIDVKIVLRESDAESKYELFQRLNTGGSPLSDQEIRNCLLVMANKEFFAWIKELGSDENFIRTTSLSDRAGEEQYDLELITRFIVFRRIKQSILTERGLRDLALFLNKRVVERATDVEFDRAAEETAFRRTFRWLADALDDDAFRRFDVQRTRFAGPFLISAFEAIALGLGYNVERYKGGVPKKLKSRVTDLWKNQEFLRVVSRGVSGSSRIPKSVRLGRELFKP